MHVPLNELHITGGHHSNRMFFIDRVNDGVLYFSMFLCQNYRPFRYNLYQSRPLSSLAETYLILWVSEYVVGVLCIPAVGRH